MAMFGSILLLLVLPWLDQNPVKSARFRPVFKWLLLLLFVDFFALMYAGAKPPEGLPLRVGQLGTIYYFAFFLLAVPYLSRREKTLPVPNSISEDPCCKK
jgi:ubiquinol-cytochrome c reductase cytochrome b subunit